MISQNIENLKKKVHEICSRTGRKYSDLQIVAVSKKNSPASIIEAKKCGIINFGENKAQEFKSKFPECPDDIKWHFIGHLQTNKVKDIIAATELIHSVDSMKLAKEINKRAGNIGKIQRILLEINTAGEASKFGLQDYSEILELAVYCKDLPNVSLEGLMTMAPYTSDEEILRNSFRSLKNIFSKLNDNGFQLCELSMGMTNDFEIAIEEGATLIRIGTAIFGERQ